MSPTISPRNRTSTHLGDSCHRQQGGTIFRKAVEERTNADRISADVKVATISHEKGEDSVKRSTGGTEVAIEAAHRVQDGRAVAETVAQFGLVQFAVRFQLLVVVDFTITDYGTFAMPNRLIAALFFGL